MKKILFTTTALVAGAMISSAAMADGMASTRYSSSMKSSSMSSANQLQSTRYLQQNDMMGASAFKATVGGYANWMVGYADNQNVYTSGGFPFPLPVPANANEFDVMGDAQVHFDFAASLKNGMKVGATAQLVADTTSEAGSIDQTYMYVESKYGKLMVGRHDNVNKQLSLHAIDLGALDIQETELNRWVINPMDDNLAGGFDAVTEIYYETTATYFVMDRELTKISYITPNFSGFQAGATYAPRGINKKDDVTDIVGNSGGDGTDAAMITAIYSGMYNGVGYGISAGYGFNSMVEGYFGGPDTSHKWNIGGRVAYNGFSLSAAYKSMDTGYSYEDNLSVWDVGVAYEQGPYGVSLSYLTADYSETDGSNVLDNQTLLLSGVYNMAAGVDAFATFGWGDYKFYDEPRDENDGFAVIGGMMLSF